MYYHPDIEINPILPEEESAHCVQVLRAGVGDEIEVTDGKGTLYRCRIVNAHRKRCEVEIICSEKPTPLHHGWIHIAIAPTKMMDRLEWFVEKATEMGVDEITLLLCEHSERKVVNEERVAKIMVAASKQSLRSSYPIINTLTGYKDFMSKCEGDGAEKYIAHCEDGYAAKGEKRYLSEYLNPFGCEETDRKICVLIGPEGDFSPAEITLAKSLGWKPVSLGNGRLRTETAALVACHTAVLALE